MVCNQMCMWNDPLDGCMKPDWTRCSLSNMASPEKPKTNADHIRTMSDEEQKDLILAIHLGYSPWCDYHCENKGDDGFVTGVYGTGSSSQRRRHLTMNEGKLKHDIFKELWSNRPWIYLPEVWHFMKDYPLKKGDKFWIWIRDCFYLNWQVWFKEGHDNG